MYHDRGEIQQLTLFDVLQADVKDSEGEGGERAG